jgi:DNA-directed RNA polymerase II subunit RPB1
VSSQASKPIIGFIQDSLLGCKLITLPGVTISQEEVISFLGHTSINSSKIPNKPFFTGHEFLSLLFPNDFDYHNDDVIIKKGKFIGGVLTKKHMGIATNSIIHILWLYYPIDEVVEIIDNIQTVINYFLTTQGFSVGLSDCIADPVTQSKINEIVSQSELKVQQLNNRLENEDISEELHESMVLNLLNGTRDSVGSLATKNVFGNNRIRHMVTAGSKGSPLNISQIMGLVGQQVARNASGTTARITNGMTDRPLPSTMKHSRESSDRGFVSSSYLTGLKPDEFFYHSMSGREGFNLGA